MKKVNVEDAVSLTLCHDITAMRDGFKGAALRMAAMAPVALAPNCTFGRY